MKTDERTEYAQAMLAKNPELFPEEHRSAILRGVIEIGFTPIESEVAGGAFAYKVTADPNQWSPASDPFDVMKAQSVSPDNSEIWMTFRNSTQFLTESDSTFQIYFTRGKVSKINRTGNE